LTTQKRLSLKEPECVKHFSRESDYLQSKPRSKRT
jgi:hypothetical protein